MSFTSLNFHLVFATKLREPLLSVEAIDRLGAFINGMLRKRKCLLYSLGGYRDHVHILFRMHPSLAPSDLVRVLKANSSRWLKEEVEIEGFSWQIGYWAYSVSISRLPELMGYISKQEEHHSKKSFEMELEEFHNAADGFIDELGES